jgi:hypothetical protein
MSLTASEILRRHAIERYLRASIRSANLDGDMSSTPRMSESAWVTSCTLVRGVPAELLDILGVRECESAGWVWREVLVEVQGEDHEVRAERSCVPLTLVQAAQMLGLDLSYAQIKAMRTDAIRRVTDNQVRRTGAQEGAAA